MPPYSSVDPGKDSRSKYGGHQLCEEYEGVSYLTKPPQVVRRRKLPVAYTHPRYADAKRARQNLGRDLASTQ